MPRYVIERTLPGAGKLSDRDLKALSIKSRGGRAAHGTRRYPTAVSVSRCIGWAGSASSFWRRCPM
ncbi:hypothetical protein H6CHR_00654 [Variovorax sp. PBL-H6]|nr:hypothetical protein H6CHR_00654 [Variovorax sp. PBL-H6]